MLILTAWWGMGFSALMVATVTFGWYLLRRDKAIGLAGLILTLISTAMLWIGQISRAARGNEWPLVTSSDSAAGIALIMLLLYSLWKLFSRELGSGFAVVAVALVLLSYGLGQQSPSPFHQPLPATGVLIGTLLKLCGGSLLALAAAISVTPLIGSWLSPRPPSQIASPMYSHAHAVFAGRTQNSGPQANPAGQQNDPASLQQVSEILVRGALLCLALSLAIDTWWLQKVGLGNANDAQQAGIALAWMVYFGALRLRANPRWRGWPWAAILNIGFLCVLPILIDAPWLEKTLPI
jgi:hypothetical protein